MAKSYLYAVQDQEGREVVSAVVEVEKVGEVTATRDEDGGVNLWHNDDVLDGAAVGKGVVLTLHRWPADDKLSAPVSHPVTR